MLPEEHVEQQTSRNSISQKRKTVMLYTCCERHAPRSLAVLRMPRSSLLSYFLFFTLRCDENFLLFFFYKNIDAETCEILKVFSEWNHRQRFGSNKIWFWALEMVVDKSRNIPEHSGTFRNIPEHRIIMRKICKIKFSKTEKTSNLEAERLKLHRSLGGC